MNKREKGGEGEVIAAQYLTDLGYTVIKKNYSCRTGEIDIIADDNGTLVFIEVKLRQNTHYGYPREAVGYKKQQAIKKLAAKYLTENRPADISCRFDVIEILQGTETQIEHIKDAFW